MVLVKGPCLLDDKPLPEPLPIFVIQIFNKILQGQTQISVTKNVFKILFTKTGPFGVVLWKTHICHVLSYFHH